MNFDEDLYNKWVQTYDKFCNTTDENGELIDDINDMDFCNFAVGFFMGQGLDYLQALKFYGVCVKRGKF